MSTNFWLATAVAAICNQWAKIVIILNIVVASGYYEQVVLFCQFPYLSLKTSIFVEINGRRIGQFVKADKLGACLSSLFKIGQELSSETLPSVPIFNHPYF